jgi:phytoene dehydrogenase-like protein
MGADSQSTTFEVIIIGSGHNGLIAANYLADAGRRVGVFEAASWAGGMTSCAFDIPNAPNHTRHAGAVDVIFLRRSGIVEELALSQHGLVLVDVDPGYVYLDPAEGLCLPLWRDADKTAQEIERFSRRDAVAYRQLVGDLSALARTAMPFMALNPTRPAPRGLAAVARAAIGDRKALRRVMDAVLSRPNEFLRRQFEHPAVRGAIGSLIGAGGSPGQDGNGLALMYLALLHTSGVARPIGGMQQLADSLVDRLESRGSSVVVNAPVAQVTVEHGRAVGVVLQDGRRFDASQAVVAACAPQIALGDLLPDVEQAPRLRQAAQRMPANADGSGDLKVDLALSSRLELPLIQALRNDFDLRLPCAMVGNLEAVERAYALASIDEADASFPFWAVIPSAVDPTQAPPGEDVLYLWSGWVPANDDAERTQAAAATLVEQASKLYGDLTVHEVGRVVEGTTALGERFRTPNGCLGHIDFDIRRTGPFRPARGLGGYRTGIPGYYLTGAGTHPGSGVSGFSGRNTAARILSDLRRHR